MSHFVDPVHSSSLYLSEIQLPKQQSEQEIIRKLKIVLGDQPALQPSAPDSGSNQASDLKKFEKRIFNFKSSKYSKAEQSSAFAKRKFERRIGRLAFTSEVPSSMKLFVSIISFITAGIFAIYQTYKLYGDVKIKNEIKQLKQQIETYKSSCNPSGDNVIKREYGEAYASYLYKGLEIANQIIGMRESDKRLDIYFRIQAIGLAAIGFVGIIMATPVVQLFGFSACAITVFYLAIKQGIASYKEWDKLSELEDQLYDAQLAKDEWLQKKQKRYSSGDLNEPYELSDPELINTVDSFYM